MIIFDLSSGIWWASVAEVFVFFPFGFFVFCLDGERMGPIWMFLPHLLRAVLGLIIIKKMPTTQELVQQNSLNLNNAAEKIPIGKIEKYVITGAKESMDLIQTRAGKLLLVYSILTAAALVLDVFVILIGIGGMNNDAGAYGTVFILLLGIFYLLVALYYIGWVISVKMRLPASVATQVTFALFGLFKKIAADLGEKYLDVNGGVAPAGASQLMGAGGAGGAKPTEGGQRSR